VYRDELAEGVTCVEQVRLAREMGSQRGTRPALGYIVPALRIALNAVGIGGIYGS